MKFRFVAFLLFVSSCIAFSQVNFYNYNDIHGIPMRETYSICKDTDGFIWAASKTGILRISESTCHVYQLPFNSANIISTKLLFADPKLYAYTNNGQLFVYDELLDCFNLLVDLRQISDNSYISVNKMIVDNEQNIWIASSIGLYKQYDNEYVISNSDSLNTQYIALYDDTHLFAAMDDGIYIVNTRTLQRELIRKFVSDDFIQVSSLYYDKAMEKLWIGTISNGFLYYDLKEKRFDKASLKNFPRHPVLAITPNSDSTMLVGIDGQGIWEISKDGNSVLNIYVEDADNPLSLHGDGVYDIFCDDGGRTWVGTYAGGLSFFDQGSSLVNQITHQINNPNSLTNNYVNSIIEDVRGSIWFGTNNGISHWDPSSNQWNTFYQNKTGEEAKVVQTLCEDNNGNIWAGTYSKGIYVLDGKTGKELAHHIFEKQGENLSGKFITDIIKDSEGDIWIGGLQDVICYRSQEKQFRFYSPQPINSLTELSPGKILLGCTYALILLDKKRGNIDYLLLNRLIHDICVVKDRIWIATNGDGLIQLNYKTREYQTFNTHTGLISNYINSIVYDKGYLWIGAENGLCKLNVEDNKIHSYSSIFPLSTVSFNINAHQRLNNGNLIWGTNNGALLFNPDALHDSPLEGEIFFQDITVSGRSIRKNSTLLDGIPVNKQSKLSLSYNQNNFILEMFAMGLPASETKFSWMLEGLDSDWNQPANYPIITYSNLPSGEFSLKIKMHNSSLSQVIDERILFLNIKPPFWKTGWFRVILFVVLLTIAYTILRFYIHRLKQRHAEDKIRFFTNIAHDIRTSLTLINTPITELNKSNELSEKSRYYLNVATEQSEKLSFVTTQLLDFQKVDVGKGQLFPVMADIVQLLSRRVSMFESVAKKKNIELVFSSSSDSFVTALDEIKVEKIIDNLLSNAIKYSHPNSRIDITLHTNKKEWSLEVKDYGLGISDKAKEKLFKEFYREDNSVNSKLVGSGIGLLLVKTYVNMHGGDVVLESKENVGSTFRVIIPYQKVAKKAVDMVEITDSEEKNSIVVPASVPEEKPSTEKKKQILIVEDNTDLQDFLKFSFQNTYKVLIADDGIEAWNLIQAKLPDLIVSDIMMPGRDGFELCKLIKSTFETSHIPVILLTSLSEKTQQLEGLRLGADDYITKPFDMTILSQKISSIIKNREIVKERSLKFVKQIDDESILNNDLNDTFVKKAIIVVHDNIANAEFDKDEFASAMNVSISLLYKKLKSLTGQSPSDFIRTIRMNRALELLQTKKHSITEVSELCGFSSLNSFSRAFKKHFSKNPTKI